MDHISEAIERAVMSPIIRRNQRHAFWREYYLEQAEQWILQESGAQNTIEHCAPNTHFAKEN